MRFLQKTDIPQILSDHAESWLAEFLADPASHTKRYRYRHSDIKAALVAETGWKCAYCESKIGHNTPGDIEHKIPTKAKQSMIFEWSNLTTACTECNRRKNAYYVEGAEFLDPYTDEVEELIEHHGPFVSCMPRQARAEITIRILQFAHESRLQLVMRKIEKLEDFSNLIARFEAEPDPMLKALLKEDIVSRQSKTSEYSAMLRRFAKSKGLAA